MDYILLLRTVKHLKPRQVFYQVKYCLKKPLYDALEVHEFVIPKLKKDPIAKYSCYEGECFSFLNLRHEFEGWNYTENGMLWAYNQNYFDWINQEGITEKVCCEWIDRFIEELPDNKVGLDPYPIALRSINWVKFFCRCPECATKTRINSLYSQLRLLEKKLEYHLLGNHLLEDAFALYIGGTFFNDKPLLQKAEKLLLYQLEKQTLKDGAHYEQSPMYHCILLERLLDCINIGEEDGKKLKETYAIRMLGHLESITWSNSDIPLLNDSANGIAPSPLLLFDYAKRLGLKWESIPMKECGYRKLKNKNLEAIVDVGNITATYQPGHTHADTFNYELRINGQPFVVDTGVSTYNKTERRQLERSTVAHNCVSPNGLNSSEVWGGFRVGRRCRAQIREITDTVIDSVHDGFKKKCRRRFELKEDGLIVDDWYEGNAISYIHLAEGVDDNRIIIDDAESVITKPWEYSLEYNTFIGGKVIEIEFKGHCRYTIQYV